MMTTNNFSPSKIPTIAKAGDACFEELREYLTQHPDGEIPDEILASLHLLYGKNFAKALEVVDSGGIVCFQGEPSGRRVFKVPGRRPADQYLVFPAHYCSCQSFLYDVVGRSDAPCCKHQLAVRLASVLQRTQTVSTQDVALARLLLEQCG